MDSKRENVKIAPSVLAGNLADLKGEVERVRELCDYVHIDVMDGHFVPNLTIGPPVVNDLKRAIRNSVPLDVHLMVDEPEKWIPRLLLSMNEIVSFHIEAIENEKALSKVLDMIKVLPARKGLAISPQTPIQRIFNLLPLLDVVVVMGVNPGFAGQKFIPQTLQKIVALREKIEKLGLRTEIEVDGGVNLNNLAEVINAGAQIIVVGSAIFKDGNPKEAIKEFKRKIKG